MTLHSLDYWLAVSGGAVLYGLTFLAVCSAREKLPFFRVIATVYGIGLTVVAAYFGVATFVAGYLNVASGAPWPVWALPWTVTVAVLTVVIGGHVLAVVVMVADWATHPTQRHLEAGDRAAKPKLTQAELATAEAYDDEWQVEERERERMLHKDRSEQSSR